jgi:hypothetical protein
MNSTYQNISLSDVFSDKHDNQSNFGDSQYGGGGPKRKSTYKGKYNNADQNQDSGHSPNQYPALKQNFDEINQTMNKTPNVFQGRARYFIVKSNCLDNIQNSMEHGVWATTQGPTKKLISAFRTVENVILVFSLTESSSFQGVARMESEPNERLKPHVFQ